MDLTDPTGPSSATAVDLLAGLSAAGPVAGPHGGPCGKPRTPSAGAGCRSWSAPLRNRPAGLRHLFSRPGTGGEGGVGLSGAGPGGRAARWRAGAGGCGDPRRGAGDAGAAAAGDTGAVACPAAAAAGHRQRAPRPAQPRRRTPAAGGPGPARPAVVLVLHDRRPGRSGPRPGCCPRSTDPPAAARRERRPHRRRRACASTAWPWSTPCSPSTRRRLPTRATGRSSRLTRPRPASSSPTPWCCSPRGRSRLWNWTAPRRPTPGCWRKPNSPGGFPFYRPCRRHDFGYRNYKQQSRFNSINRARIDNNFYNDMKHGVCSKENVAIRWVCVGFALTYYKFVRAFGGRPNWW
jgi:hypothetical protein